MTILTCTNCHATKPEPTGTPTDHFPSDHCDECAPWLCDSCGQTCSFAAPCRCWIQLDTLHLADIKALFTGDGTFSVDPRPAHE